MLPGSPERVSIPVAWLSETISGRHRLEEVGDEDGDWDGDEDGDGDGNEEGDGDGDEDGDGNGNEEEDGYGDEDGDGDEHGEEYEDGYTSIVLVFSRRLEVMISVCSYKTKQDL